MHASSFNIEFRYRMPRALTEVAPEIKEERNDVLPFYIPRYIERDSASSRLRSESSAQTTSNGDILFL